MRWTTSLITPLLAVLLAGPALAQDGPDATKDPGEKLGHMEMRMHGAMAGMMAAHAEHLDLSADQVERLRTLDARLEAEKERHHAEMRSIHESGMAVLTPEQRDRMHELMGEMRTERGDGHGEMKKPGDKKTDDHDDH